MRVRVQVRHHLSLPAGQLQVHLTRDEADAARLMAGPQAFTGPEGVERSWGSMEELIEGTRLPPYPRTVHTTAWTPGPASLPSRRLPTTDAPPE